MTEGQINLIIALLGSSVIFLAIPVCCGIYKWIARMRGLDTRNRLGANDRMLFFPAMLLLSIWCLRYAVGYYLIEFPPEDVIPLTPAEEAFNSVVHTLQTFSMDEDYTAYITDGKAMMFCIGATDFWVEAYGVYAAVLNALAPIIGGAIILEIVASIFPRIGLRLRYLAVWQEKYYFSELNERSLALVKSISEAYRTKFIRPVIIFCDVYADREAEDVSEMMMAAKGMGAICLRDDLAHIAKTSCGQRKFFLIDDTQIDNLKMLTALAEPDNSEYLKDAEVYLFCRDMSYIQVESRVREKLTKASWFRKTTTVTEVDGKTVEKTTDNRPVIIPVRSRRNLVATMLDKLPLYEPLIHKAPGPDGNRELRVTILGTGTIGTEMFLSTYWIGQMLDCRVHIQIVSQEGEDAFWGRMDAISPEIRRSMTPGDPILRINRKGDMAEPYCTVSYLSCDIRDKAFLSRLEPDAEDLGLLKTDYFVVALGSDEENMATADLLLRNVGRFHLRNPEARTVIAYVVYNSELAAELNGKKRYYSTSDRADIYMQAIGSRAEVYSEANVFLSGYKAASEDANAGYELLRDNKRRAEAQQKRIKDDYNYWASNAQVMHYKYKVFSTGMIQKSIFDFADSEDGEKAYREAFREASEAYKQMVRGEKTGLSAEEQAKIHTLWHRLAWLEHRRWNAYIRTQGFRHTDDWKAYAKRVNDHKHRDYRLHPCLVECSQKGIYAQLDAHGVVIPESRFRAEDRSGFDLLDELTYAIYDAQVKDYDFKQYDYPNSSYLDHV